MSELDDLRRIAYGRTSSAADEAAAADARSTLAQHDAAARAETDGANPPDPEGEERDGSIALDIVDPGNEPGYLHRLVTTWRVWAVPAFAAFIVGIVLTVASGWFILNANSASNITPDTNTSQRFLEGSELLDPDAVSPNAVTPGDLGAAFELFARAQQPDDVTEGLDSGIDTASTRLVYVSEFDEVYAAKTVGGSLCLLLVSPNSELAMTSCADETSFVAQGLSIRATRDAGDVRITWDGVTASDSPAR